MDSTHHTVRSGLLLLTASITLILTTGCHKPEAAPRTPPSVQVIQAEQRDVPIYSEWVGTLEGYINAQIQPRVTGYIFSQNYKEGSFVRTGDLLFQIDPRQYQAALEQARAQREQAQAALNKSEIDVKRLEPLAKERVVSQQELDNAVAAYEQNRAAVAAAQAAVANAQLNVAFTRVTAPIGGIAGAAQTQIGNLVSTTSVLTTISTVNPIKVSFSISEQEHLSWIREHPDAEQRAAEERSARLEMILVDGSIYPYPGKFSFADREIDVRTGALRLQGVFPNPGNVLRPGQFARVRAVTKTFRGAVLVPQRAVQELQGTYRVAVVAPDNRVAIRSVKVGERVGSMWIIDQGVRPGERIVAEGFQRVAQGMLVTPSSFPADAKQTAAAGRP